MQDDTKPPHDSWIAAITIDSMRHLDPALLLVNPEHCQWSSVTNQVTLDNMHGYVEGLGWFDHTVKPVHPIQGLLSKVLNQRCRGRRYCAVALRSLGVDLKNNEKQPKFSIVNDISRKLKQIVLCGLLGNYRHSKASTRPPANVRLALYDLLDYDPTHKFYEHKNKWFLHMIRHASGVLMYCLRDYLVYAVQDNPAFYNRLRSVMFFDQFEGIVSGAMHLIREYFTHNLCEPLSALYHSVRHPEDISSGMRWAEEISWVVSKSHTLLLRITFKRATPSLVHMILSARRSIAMVPIIRDDPRLINSDDSYQDSLLPFINPPQYSFLVSVMEVNSDLFWAIEHLKYIGVSESVCALLANICKSSVTSQALFRRHLFKLSTTHPHAYNMLQVIAQINRDKSRFKTLTPPPLHYTQSQIAATQARFNLSKPNILMKETAYLFFCPVCDTIYSLLRDFHSVYKADYEYGLRDAIVDYDTGEVYCNRNKVSHVGACSDTPLMRVPILGQLLLFHQKIILLCGQPRCGMPMVLDTNLAMHNEHGYACSVCTMKSKKQKDEFKKKVDRYCRPPGVNRLGCLMCSTEMTRLDQVYLYPFDIWMCKKHNNTRMINHTIECLRQYGTSLDRDKLCALLVQSHSKQRKQSQDRNSVYVKRMLAFHKKRTTAKSF